MKELGSRVRFTRIVNILTISGSISMKRTLQIASALSLSLSSPAEGQAVGRLFEAMRRKSSLEAVAIASAQVDSILTFRSGHLKQTVESSRGCFLQVLRRWDSGPHAGKSEKVVVDAGELLGNSQLTMDPNGRLAISRWDVRQLGDATGIANPGGTTYPTTVDVSIGQSIDDPVGRRRLASLQTLVTSCEKWL